MRTKLIIGVGVAVVALAVIVAISLDSDGPTAPTTTTSGLIRPMQWADVEGARVGVIDPVTVSMGVGERTLKAPQPIGAELSWEQRSEGTIHSLRAEGAGDTKYTWTAAEGNPHTVFSGRVVAPRGELTEAITSIIELPDGEVTYMSDSLARLPFAGTSIQLSALTRGPIIWRNGEDTIALWQWHADRVTLAASEDGGVQVQFHWWEPKLHPVPPSCAKELNAMEIEVAPRLTISFGEVPQFGLGRLPDGVTSAVVPLFIDPQNLEDVRFQDGASASAEDFVNRARTIAFGHSLMSDARYGNGGLVGLDAGGTIAVPAGYEIESKPFAELSTSMAAAKIELTPEAELRPTDCAELVATLGSGAPLLGTGRAFDGKFPNLFAPDQRDAIPGVMGHTPIWRPTALTGRRKDVVTQALSSTYLTRLADARGVAILEIPLVATRNPLVAVAAESLLEPERSGQWTIEESVARALAEVELLSEDDRFDFVGIGRFARYNAAIQNVEIGQAEPGTWRVFNRVQAVDGFTMVFDHEVSITVDGEPVSTALRTLGNGARQTWAWWDLAEGVPYEVEIEADVAPGAVTWSVAK